MLYSGRWRIVFQLGGALVLLLAAQTSRALSVTNIPAADASLMEVAPNNSIGAQSFVLAGKTQNGPRVRALYQFNLTALPTNTVILSGKLQLDCTKQSSESMCVTNSAFGLHRMFRAWGEGTNVALSSPGQGRPANAGDATWNHAFYPTNAWAAPGGLVDVDFSGIESSFQTIGSPDMSPYRFESTPELVDDLQTWVRNPAANFGWMLLASTEATICTAKRLNSREDTNSQPQLEIEFLVPPRFDLAQRIGNQFQMRFTPWPGQTYAVLFRGALPSSNWQTLTNLGAATNSSPVIFSDEVTNLQRFYRLSTY